LDCVKTWQITSGRRACEHERKREKEKGEEARE
jgi:hypothetical protein